MRITKDNIQPLVDALEKWKQENPRLSFLAGDALMMGSGDETAVLMTPDELLGNQSICGSAKESCFDEKVVEFLKDRGVKFVIVGLMLDDFEDTGFYMVVGGAVPLPYDDKCPNPEKWLNQSSHDCLEDICSSSDVLSWMIMERNGSWRNDCCKEPGWSTFESE